MNQDDDMAARLQTKLTPENMGAALVRAGAILTGYELVKTTIVDRTRSFFSFNVDENSKPIQSEQYQREVLARGTNAITGSIEWLIYMNAITAAQAAAFTQIRAHRGEVAHELARLLVDPDAEVDIRMLCDLRYIMWSLDRFWGSIEVDINPDLDGRRDDIDLEEIKSGSRLVLDYVCNLAGLD